MCMYVHFAWKGRPISDLYYVRFDVKPYSRTQSDSVLNQYSIIWLMSMTVYNWCITDEVTFVMCMSVLYIYLRQGGYVFAGFCLFVCLFVCLCVNKITQKVMDGSFWNFEGMLGIA